MKSLTPGQHASDPPTSQWPDAGAAAPLPGTAAATSLQGAAAAGAVEPPAATCLDRVTVLLIDDEPDLRATAELLLREAGAQVLSAGNAVDGLALLCRHHPQVMLSDLGMPGLDGYQLLRRVRELPDPVARRTPAAAVSAFASPEDRQRALSAGFQLHLIKPVPPGVLIAAVARLSRLGVAE